MEERHPSADNGLIYGLNDRPPFKEAFFAACSPSSWPSSHRPSSLPEH